MAEVVGLLASTIQIAQISKVVLTICCRYIGKVRHATDDVSQTIQNVGQLIAILADLEIVIRGQDDDERSRLDGLIAPQGALTLCKAGIKELEAKLSQAVGSGQMTFREKLKWPFESKKITEILNTLEKQRSLLEIVLVGDTNVIGRQIKLSLEDMKLREEREKILNWLRCGDPMVKHLDSRKLCQEGSNSWMLESPDFKAWKDNMGEIFWIHAIAGAGKTILCSSIIEHMMEICENNGNRIAFFYFSFNDVTTQKLGHILRSLIVQLSEYDPKISLELRLLYEKCDDGRTEPDDKALASVLFGILSEGVNSFLIVDALDEFPPEERKRFLDLIAERKKVSASDDSSQYNILLTSRKELDIEQAISKISQVTKIYDVFISAKDVDADIRLYVRQFLANQDHGTFKNLSPEIRKEIEEKLLKGASGMFRWVACQLGFIQKCKQASAIRRVLNSLPQTLEETYDRILLSIPEETWQIARSALMLLTYSLRPITLQELAEGVVVDLVNQVFDADEQRLIYYRDVLEICSSLVTVSNVEPNHKESSWLFEKSQIERNQGRIRGHIEVVQLAHFSVQEYLVARGTEGNPQISRFRFTKRIAHRSLAQLSLIYLMDFSKGVRLLKIDFKAFPFLAYASQYWTEHWRQSLMETKSEECEREDSRNVLLKRLFDIKEPNYYINVLNVCNPDILLDLNMVSTSTGYRRFYFGQTSPGRSLDSFPPPLYYAVQLGDRELCEWLLEVEQCDINARSGKFGQAIQAASRFGHENIVRFLLENNAEVNTFSGRYGSPLQAAAYAGHENIVRLLLDHGADVDAKGGRFGSALIAACHQNRFPVARILVQRGADMDIICSKKGKALNIAANTGNIQLIQLLLKNGADINDPCGGEGTLLYAAAGHGDIQTVKMLIRLGADVNFRSGSNSTALQNACAGKLRGSLVEKDPVSRAELVKLLLKNGADVNIRGGRYGTALQAAVDAGSRGNSGPGDIEIVSILMDNGADIHYQGGMYHSAIRAAVFCGNSEAARVLIERGVEIDDDVFVIAVKSQRKSVIPLLLQRGVNVNAENDDGTVLQLAIKNDDLDTVKILLDDPLLDVNTRGGRYDETALYHAVQKENFELVKLLLSRGAAVNETCRDGMRCLNLAALKGNIELARFLIEHGADVNAHSPKALHSTVLITVCSSLRPRLEMVRFLVEQKANVNAWGYRMGDALQAASANGHKQIVEFLLSSGADPRAPDSQNGGCLEAALRGGQFAIFHLLLDAGANVNHSRSHDHPPGYHRVGSPLLAAIQQRRKDIVTLLLDRGADVNIRGTLEGSPLSQALQLGLMEISEILISRGADINQRAGYEGCPLMSAIKGRTDGTQDPAFIQWLIDAGADVNLTCGDCGNPLVAAVSTGKIKVVEKLLDNGAEINMIDRRYGSALHLAITEGDLDIFRLLLDRGADINYAPLKLGFLNSMTTALTQAVGHPIMLRELLERGADPKVGDSVCLVRAAAAGKNDLLSTFISLGADPIFQDGVPGKALQLAARNGHIKTCEFLLDHGADVNAFGGDYGNALMATLTSYNENIVIPMVKFLLERGASVNPPPSKEGTSALQLAILKHFHELVDIFLEKGADIHAYHPIHGTALAMAVRRVSDLPILQKLLEKGADLSLSGEKCGTPLQQAAAWENHEAIELLLNHGADINQISTKKGSALAAACVMYGRRSTIRLLLDRGADINLQGGKYGTPLQYAAKKGHLDIVRYLIANGADPFIKGGKYTTPVQAAEMKRKHCVVNFLKRYMNEKKGEDSACV